MSLPPLMPLAGLIGPCMPSTVDNIGINKSTGSKRLAVPLLPLYQPANKRGILIRRDRAGPCPKARGRRAPRTGAVAIGLAPMVVPCADPVPTDSFFVRRLVLFLVPPVLPISP